MNASLVIVSMGLVVASLRARADVINEEDFSIGKEAQMQKARQLLASDSVDEAYVLLNMVVGDVNAKDRISSKEAESIVNAYLTLGSMQSGHGSRKMTKYNDYGRSYTWYRKAADMAEDYEMKPQFAKALLGIAVKYEVQLSSYNDSVLADTLLSTLKRSVRLSIESEAWETVDMAMKNLASSAFSHGRGEDIAEELERYYELTFPGGDKNHNHEFVKAFCRTRELLEKNDMEGALRETYVMENYSANSITKKIDTYSIRTEILFRDGQMEEVMKCVDTVSKAVRDSGNLWYEMQLEHSKSNIYSAMGRKAEADSCRFLYYDCRERLFEDRSANRIKDLHFLSRIDNVTLQMQKITLERQYARTLFMIAVVVALIFGIMLLLLIRANRNLRESHKRIFEEYSKKLKEDSDVANSINIKTEECPLLSDMSVQEVGDDKYKSSLLTEEQKDEVLVKIKTTLNHSESVLSSKYQIKDLATEAGVSARNISQVINERCGCNFATFLAEHRINTACRRINESASYRKLTVEAIATSVGIQSRSHFSTTFKKIVGLNPSDYIRQAEEKAQQSSQELDN